MNKNEFVESIQFNYMFDFDWLLQQYPAENRLKPLTLVFDNRSEKELKQMANLHHNVRLIKVFKAIFLIKELIGIKIIILIV